MYITVEELFHDVPKQEAVNLCNDEDRNEKGESEPNGWDLSDANDVIVLRLNKAITDSAEEIDGYLRKRYSLPLTETPERIKKLCKGITRYNLFSRRMVEIPETVLKQYQELRAELEQIRSGEMVLDIEMQQIYMTNKTAEDRVFTSEELSRF